MFKNKKPVIAIDGTAGSGKGTLAKSLSKVLDFNHLDTGLLYRIYAFESLNNKGPEKVNININEWFENNSDIEKLRTEKISQIASQISKLKYVRDSLVTLQRNFADNPDRYPRQ